MIKSFLAIGNGEKCPYCNTIINSRPDHKGEDIVTHLFSNHKKETYEELFGEKHDK